MRVTETNEAIRALQAADKAAWKARWKYVLDETGIRVGRASAVRKAKPKRVRSLNAKPSGTIVHGRAELRQLRKLAEHARSVGLLPKPMFGATVFE